MTEEKTKRKDRSGPVVGTYDVTVINGQKYTRKSLAKMRALRERLDEIEKAVNDTTVKELPKWIRQRDAAATFLSKLAAAQTNPSQKHYSLGKDNGVINDDYSHRSSKRAASERSA